jgi:uncharacterized protein (DUF1330 family)
MWTGATPMAAEPTRHVLIFGVDVRDEPGYRRYRDGMTPILAGHGGAFGYDFIVSQVLKSETEAPINRVFTMIFPERSVAERFFSDPAYRAVRAELFDSSVGAVTKIGSYDEATPGDRR